MAIASAPGLNRIMAYLAGIANPEPAMVKPLLEEWTTIIIEGNRRGVLSGLDGNNHPAPPLRYRNGAGLPTRNRMGMARRATHDVITFGPNAPNPAIQSSVGFSPNGGNLTISEYKKLTGPRLAGVRARAGIGCGSSSGVGSTGAFV